MPRNTRTGTNTNSNICDVTPSQSQYNSSLERRVAAIEAVLSRLLGGNVSANQLSDISGNGGVITDMVATASNAAGGWVTDGTFTGTAISTLGWKLFGPNGTLVDFPIVTMENGHLVYGWQKSGQPYSPGGTAGTTTDYAYFAFTPGFSTSKTGSNGITIAANSLSASTCEGLIQFIVGEPGLYLACAGGTPIWASPTGNKDWYVTLNSPHISGLTYRNRHIGNDLQVNSHRVGSNVTGIFPLTSGGIIYAQYEITLGAASSHDGLYAWVCKIG